MTLSDLNEARRKLPKAGIRFGRLVTTGEYTVMPKWGTTLWVCKCECGTIKAVMPCKLRNKRTNSCGCTQGHPKHRHAGDGTGKGRSRIYACWLHIMNRCYNKKDKNYRHYGGRGIFVCKRWHKFKNFLEDMAPRPAGLSIDRIDNNGGYNKRNCRWATSFEQSTNRRDIRMVEYKGERLPLFVLANKLGIKKYILYSRVFVSKWSLERAINEPINKAR